MSSDLIQRIRNAIACHQMWRPGGRVGVGVSGGSDSVALLLLLKQLSDEQGIRLTVVHFNHRLRGRDADRDEQFVAALAGRLELPCVSGSEDVARIARLQRWNLEDAARRLRYGFFAALLAEDRIDRMAVAHTADDQAETVLARIVRGTGPAGLAAIYPVNGGIVRPLLEVRRPELREYLQELGQEWREDASNYDRSRMRSRLRHEVLPLLEREVSPAVVSHLGRLAKMSREDEAFWKALTRDRLASLVERADGKIRVRCSNLLHPLPNTAGIPVSDAAPEARLAVTRRLVRGIVEQARGHCRQWTADHVESVLRLATSGTSGSRVELPGIMVERSFDWLQFTPVGQQPCSNSLRNGFRDRFWKGRPCEFAQVVELGSPGDATVVVVPEIRRRFHLKVVDWYRSGSDTDRENAVDRDLLGPPLVLRNWQPGDSFRPKGRRSSHKLTRLLGTKRVGVPDRAGWPVLTSANTIVWARGLPVAAEFAVHAGTRAGLVIGEEKI